MPDDTMCTEHGTPHLANNDETTLKERHAPLLSGQTGLRTDVASNTAAAIGSPGRCPEDRTSTLARLLSEPSGSTSYPPNKPPLEKNSAKTRLI